MSLVSFKATPASTYEKANTSFKYNVQVYYNGLALTNQNGNPITAIVYIGVKGDANLDNVADATDASTVLAYYAKVQTGTPAEEAIIYSAEDKNLENLAAFLADVDMDEYSADNFKNGKTSANKDNGKRAVDASDASSILKFYATAQTERDRSAYDIWFDIFGDKIKKKVA